MVKVGDAVMYVPSKDYWLDTGPDRQHVFELIDGHTKKPYIQPAAGGIKMKPARTLSPGKVLSHWIAIVKAIYPDGSAALEIQHPCGHRLFHTKVSMSSVEDKKGVEHPLGSWYTPEKGLGINTYPIKPTETPKTDQVIKPTTIKK